MKQETKDKLAKASAEADTITDAILAPVEKSDYSWLILAITHALAFGVGAYYF